MAAGQSAPCDQWHPGAPCASSAPQSTGRLHLTALGSEADRTARSPRPQSSVVELWRGSYGWPLTSAHGTPPWDLLFPVSLRPSSPGTPASKWLSLTGVCPVLCLAPGLPRPPSLPALCLPAQTQLPGLVALTASTTWPRAGTHGKSLSATVTARSPRQNWRQALAGELEGSRTLDTSGPWAMPASKCPTRGQGTSDGGTVLAKTRSREVWF